MADRGRKKQNTNQQSGNNRGGGQSGRGGSFAPAEGFKFEFSSNANDKKQQQGGGKGQQPKLENVIDFNSKEGQALLKGIQAKFTDLVGKSSGYLESLPQSVQNRVKALKKLQADHDSLEEEFDKELDALEKKYEALKKPLYDRRSAIVVGESEPTPAELAFEDKRKKEEPEKGEGEQPKKEGEAKKEEPKKEGEQPKKEEGKAGDNNNNKDESVKGIPEFWLQALRHHPDFADLITDKDLDALKYLKDLRVKTLEDEVSFVVEFQFDPNPYFDETLLTKTYHLRERGGEIMYQSVDGTEIHWKPGKNLTVTIVTKTTGGGRGGRRGGRRGGGNQQARTIKVEQPCESFFNFFNPEAFTALGEEEDDLEDEELEALLEADYEMGAAIKEQIIPNAVEWFTGEAELEYDEYESGEDGEDDEDDDDDEEGEEGGEGEDYNSEEDEDYKPPPPGQEQQPECKQQ